MKRTLKATHAAFLAKLDTELLSLGAEKYVHDPAAEWRAEVPGYRFQTRHGVLELHPSLPIRLTNGRRTDYHLTVFGRFPDAQRAAESLGHWKWNHHFGYRTPDEIDECITHLVRSLSPMLVTSPVVL